MTIIDAIGPRGQAAATTPKTDAEAANRVLPYNMAVKGSRSGELSTSQQFESFVLQSFIEPMLPKEDSTFFGSGTAGNIWRSMLAERIGAEMAASGGIGIAALVEKRNADIEAAAKAQDQMKTDGTRQTGARSTSESL